MGNVAPVATIGGVVPYGVAVDYTGYIYAFQNLIGVFAPNADGNATPSGIFRARTLLKKQPHGSCFTCFCTNDSLVHG